MQSCRVARQHIHPSDNITRVQGRLRRRRWLIFRKVERNVYRTRTSHGVGSIVYIVFVEAVIALVVQYFRDAFALVIECQNGELAWVGGIKALRKVRFKNVGYYRILNVVAETVYHKRLTRKQRIYGFQLFAPHFRVENYTCVHITHIVHCHTKVFARQTSLQCVVVNGLFADALQRSVYPFGSISPCQRVGSERYFKEREPP